MINLTIEEFDSHLENLLICDGMLEFQRKVALKKLKRTAEYQVVIDKINEVDQKQNAKRGQHEKI